MTEPKRTTKSRRTPPRAPRRKLVEPPVIENVPFHKEVYYAGLGLADLAAEGVTRISTTLRLLEKQLVARGQQRSGPLNQQIEDARAELTRRGQELRQSVHRGVRDMWSALRGSRPVENVQSTAAPGTP
jgi:hypothetical protein